MAKLMTLETNYGNEERQTQDMMQSSIEKIGVFKCDQCNFHCNKEITLRKHTNNKHGFMTAEKELETNCESKCSLCEDKFTSLADLTDHLEEHICEIN